MIHGISFKSDSESGLIFLDYIHEVVFEGCTFEGVRINIYYADNVSFIRCSFSNYNLESSSNIFYYTSQEALYISYSNTSIIQSNFSHCRYGAIVYSAYTSYSSRQNDLFISSSSFHNNTSDRGGSAILYINSGEGSYITIEKSSFIFNGVNDSQSSGHGGAIQITGTGGGINCSIESSFFISNLANFCGALSISKSANNVEVNNSFFYYNRALDPANIGGGAACLIRTEVSISNSLFVGNSVEGNGGVMMSDNSTIDIYNSSFINNTAGQNGGAFVTLLYPSNYTITLCFFFRNEASRNGGAMFVRARGSIVDIAESVFVGNNATGHGGAIAMLSSTLVITDTSMYSNVAETGDLISACYSTLYIEQATAVSDPDFPFCASYEAYIYSGASPVLNEEQWYRNITSLINGYVNSSTTTVANPNVESTSQNVNIITFLSLGLTISLMCFIVVLTFSLVAVCCKVKGLKKDRNSQLSSCRQNEAQSHYKRTDKSCKYEVPSKDTNNIEMKANIIYGREEEQMYEHIDPDMESDD